jgi:hypothetical protein
VEAAMVPLQELVKTLKNNLVSFTGTESSVN